MYYSLSFFVRELYIAILNVFCVFLLCFDILNDPLNPKH